MSLHFVRRGVGPPLLLIHGLGGNWQSWETILDPLATRRDVIAIDLPGFGRTPPLPGEVSIRTLADAVSAFLDREGLAGVAAAGSSMGARLVLELARRRMVGATVALDPGGFWAGWERYYFGATIGLSIRLIRLLQPVLPAIVGNAAGRTLLLGQFSARPWRLPPAPVLRELQSYAASPSFDAALRSLVRGPGQEGMPAAEQRGPIVLVWGRNDRVCFPGQAKRALERFPGARLVWLHGCGHFPHWDRPEETLQLILAATGSSASIQAPVFSSAGTSTAI